MPESWQIVTLHFISKQISDGTHKTPKYVSKGTPFLSIQNISKGYMDFTNTKFISAEQSQLLNKRCLPEKGDLLICRIGTLGNSIIIDTEQKFSIFVSLGIIKLINNSINRFIVKVLNSPQGSLYISDVKVGGGSHTNKINLHDLKRFPIPIPPFYEQLRINNKIDLILDLLY